jgi:hypothetical protein
MAGNCGFRRNMKNKMLKPGIEVKHFYLLNQCIPTFLSCKYEEIARMYLESVVESALEISQAVR